MKKISERTLYEGKWLSIWEATFENKHGEPVVWESVRRQNSTVGVVAVAQLKPSNRFILIRQYRPAIEGYVLGFPAGLAYDDPDHALVELREETGYHGQIISYSPVLKSNSGVINDSGRVVYIHIDEEDPRNHNPIQDLEPAEDIEVLLVSATEIQDFLSKEIERGTAVGGGLWYLFVLSQMMKA